MKNHNFKILIAAKFPCNVNSCFERNFIGQVKTQNNLIPSHSHVTDQSDYTKIDTETLLVPKTISKYLAAYFERRYVEHHIRNWL